MDGLQIDMACSEDIQVGRYEGLGVGLVHRGAADRHGLL